MLVRTLGLAGFSGLVLGFAGGGFAGSETSQGVTILHLSDSHFGPYTAEAIPGDLSRERSAPALNWVRERLGAPWAVDDSGTTIPAPSLIVHTGDVTEFGFVDSTAVVADHLLGSLDLPQLWVAGNHDNTWAPRPEVFGDRSRGLRFHHVHKGIHIVGLNSATLHEPNPTMGQEEVEFVAMLAPKIPTTAPLFLAFHHPPSNGLWVSEFDLGRVIEPLRGHNLLGLLVGHHHVALHETWSGLDVLNGGATFIRREHSAISVGLLHVTEEEVLFVHHFPNSTSGPLELFRRSLKEDGSVRPRLGAVEVVSSPGKPGEYVVSWGRPVSGQVTVTLLTNRGRETVTSSDGTTAVLTQMEGRGLRGLTFRAPGLLNGRHGLKVTLRADSDSLDILDERFAEFRVEAEDGPKLAWSLRLPGGGKATPSLAGDQVIVASNDSRLSAVDLGTGSLRWSIPMPGEVLDSVTHSAPDRLLASTLRGHLVEVELSTGEVLRSEMITTGGPLISSPLVWNDRIFVAGSDGDLFALGLHDFKAQWVYRRGANGVERAPVSYRDRLYFTAWDGLFHSVAGDGSEGWAVPVPTNQNRVNRYYGAADGRPVFLRDVAFLTDRGYTLGVYELDGTYRQTLTTGVVALAPSTDGNGLILRMLNEPVRRIDLLGRQVWSSDVVGGRFPVEPVVRGGKVYVVDGRGILSCLDEETGRTLWRSQVAPGTAVLAAPVVLEDGSVVISGMDGKVQYLRPPGN
jgi:outer membrane protein assembly factor BamB/predicted phosphodiesterase